MIHENWNRYYDPSTGRYLSPEPLLQTPGFTAAMTKRGLTTPAYAYAANNPISYFDPNGLWFRNYSDKTLRVKTESRGWGTVAPGQEYEGRIDGYIDGNGRLIKVWDRDSVWGISVPTFMTVDVSVGPSGTGICGLGICTVEEVPPDDTWIPPEELEELPTKKCPPLNPPKKKRSPGRIHGPRY